MRATLLITINYIKGQGEELLGNHRSTQLAWTDLRLEIIGTFMNVFINTFSILMEKDLVKWLLWAALAPEGSSSFFLTIISLLWSGELEWLLSKDCIPLSIQENKSLYVCNHTEFRARSSPYCNLPVPREATRQLERDF